MVELVKVYFTTSKTTIKQQLLCQQNNGYNVVNYYLRNYLICSVLNIVCPLLSQVYIKYSPLFG
jgi:hypothetical protein